MARLPSYLGYVCSDPSALLDEVRRNRRRFRRHTKPYLRRTLVECRQPWEPEERTPRWYERTLWMRVHALALLDALAPLVPALCGALAFEWAGPEKRWRPADIAPPRYVEAIEVTLGVADWPAAARPLRALGYAVEQRADGLDAEGDFVVRLRADRGRHEGVGASALRAKMAGYYTPRERALYDAK